MPQIKVGDVLEFRTGDLVVIDWGYKPFSAELSEAEEYLLLLRDPTANGMDYIVTYLDGQHWRQGEYMAPSVMAYEERAVRTFQQKAERNNFLIRKR
jgi:hypothetical protein